jgi:hypothetical protein
MFLDPMFMEIWPIDQLPGFEVDERRFSKWLMEMCLGTGIPFDANFEHSMASWGRIRAWLEDIRRFANVA